MGRRSPGRAGPRSITTSSGSASTAPALRRLTRGSADDREPDWAPDGRAVAFASDREGAFDLWRVAAAGGSPSFCSTRAVTLVHPPGIRRASDSPTPGSRRSRRRVVRRPCSRRAQTAGRVPCLDGRPDWSPDGSSIAFLRGRDGTLRPWVARGGGRGARPLASAGSGVAQVDWARLPTDVAPGRALGCPISTSARRLTSSSVSPGADGSGSGSRPRPTTWATGPLAAWHGARRGGRCWWSSSSSGATAARPRPQRRRAALRAPSAPLPLAPPAFVRYELREPRRSRCSSRDRKSGFCLLDRWGLARRGRVAARSLPRFVGDCGAGQPDARRVEEGSSVGYTDRYPAFFHGQDLDITGVRAGLYVLVHRANPERGCASSLREQRGRGARAAHLARRAARGRREVDVLRRCERRLQRLVDPTQARSQAYDPAWSTSTSSSSARARRAPRPRSTSRAAGARVLLADRARFPRDKPCGGGLTGRALRQAPCDVAPVVEHVVDRFEFRLGYGTCFPRRSARAADPDDAAAPSRRVPRRAGRRGGRRLPRRRARRRVELDDRGVTARVGGVGVRADVLVGADGANGVVARAAGLGAGDRPRRRARGQRPLGRARQRERYARTAVIELGAVPGGYGWVFPKGDHANLGVGGWGSEGPAAPRHLARLASAHGVRSRAATDVRGHRLPMRRPGARPRPAACCSSATPPASSTRSPATGSTRRSSPRARRGGDPARATSTSTPPALSAALDHHAARLVGGEARARPHPRALLLGGPLAGRLRRRRGPARRRRRATRPGARPGAAPLRLLARLARR